MKININSVHFKADHKLEDFISSKVNKLAHFYEGVISSDVILKLDNTDSPENKIVEIRLVIRGNDLYAKKQAKTFEEAADHVADALKKQLTRHKEKIKEK